MENKIYIIGVGKVGSSFAFELKDINYKINFLTDRNSNRLREISSKVNPLSFSVKVEKEFIISSNIIIICVQDRFISYVLKEIESYDLDLSKKYFIHTSGSQSTGVFSSKSYNPEKLVSMHPIQTFDKVSVDNTHLLSNIYFGIEGGELAKDLVIDIINKLNSNYIEIPKDKKFLYHSACVVSSNFLITLLNVSSEIIGNIGIEKNKTFEIFKPIIEKTLQNISDDGLIHALTGPFERNDVETISNHLSSINKELPSLIPFYTLLGIETVKVAFKKESLNLKNVISILDLMNEYILNEYRTTKQTIN